MPPGEAQVTRPPRPSGVRGAKLPGREPAAGGASEASPEAEPCFVLLVLRRDLPARLEAVGHLHSPVRVVLPEEEVGARLVSLEGALAGGGGLVAQVLDAAALVLVEVEVDGLAAGGGPLVVDGVAL